MPTPRPDETESQFIERCISEVVDEGKPRDQAVAICHSLWENKMADKSQLLKSVQERRSRSGIVTADRYFRELESCIGGVCPNDDWRKAVKEAESKLTYSNPETEVLQKTIKQSTAGVLEFEGIITTPLRDRDGDVLLSKGASVDSNMPLLWQHVPMQPIGKMLRVVKQTEDEVRGRFVIADTELGRDSAKLVKVGALRISHGFDPKEFEPMEDEEGWLFKLFEIFEASLVSIPSNVQAVITDFDGKAFESEFVKGWQQSVWKDNGKVIVPVSGIENDSHESEPEDPAERTAENTKNTGCRCKKASKEFDVERQHVEAAKLEYDWISRYCSCEVKQLVNFGTVCPKIKIGSFLTGLKFALRETSEVDVRRLTSRGHETPPEYEVIQLDSKSSDHFLIDGISFRKTEQGVCFAVKYEKGFGVERVEIFSSRKDEDHVIEYLSEAWRWADENNFLKGEAFSIDGSFLEDSGLEWGDLFLKEENEREVKRSVDLMNSKGKACPNRGQVFMGPPGTGKTLSAKLIKDNVDATFIWVGGKQAYYYGGVNAVSIAFDLAKELAPSVIVMEDIDASLKSDFAIDFLKTEMDGIGKSSGVLTILTTNHPKSFPEALLDRPGRFHDVLKFDLPDDGIRTKMIDKWLPGLSGKAKTKTVEETGGYSGAHVYELCQYAKNISDQDEIEIDDAVTKAIKKIHDQRELIDEELSRDRTMASRRRSVHSRVEKSTRITKSYGFDEKRVKGGARLSQATQSEINDALSNLGAVSNMSDVPKPAQTLVNSAMSQLMGLVDDDEDKSFENIERKYFAKLANTNTDELRKAHRRLSLILRSVEEQEEAKEWDELLSQLN